MRSWVIWIAAIVAIFLALGLVGQLAASDSYNPAADCAHIVDSPDC